MLNDIKKMLSLTFEIEGLLMMAAERGDMTPPEVDTLIRSKIERLQALSVPTSLSDENAEISYDVPVSDTALAQNELSSESETDVTEHTPVKAVATDHREDPVNAESSIVASPTVSAPFSSGDPQNFRNDSPAYNANDIRRKMALNDKFLFRRELFNGDEELFSQTLSLISAMSNMDEVNDYLLNDLCFDLSDPSVARFTDIISNTLFK